jgi:hypothetical protein
MSRVNCPVIPFPPHPPRTRPHSLMPHDSTAPSLLDLTAMSDREVVQHTRPLQLWYESLADYIITHPEAKRPDIAAAMGRTEGTISLVMQSDSFQAYYRKRRDIHSEKIDAAMRQKLFKVADASLDYLLESLNKKRDSVPIEMLQRTADTALKNLGYGSTPSPSVTVNNSPQTVNVAISLSDLEAARAALRRSQFLDPPLEESAALGGSGDQSVPREAGAETTPPDDTGGTPDV